MSIRIKKNFFSYGYYRLLPEQTEQIGKIICLSLLLYCFLPQSSVDSNTAKDVHVSVNYWLTLCNIWQPVQGKPCLYRLLLKKMDEWMLGYRWYQQYAELTRLHTAGCLRSTEGQASLVRVELSQRRCPNPKQSKHLYALIFPPVFLVFRFELFHITLFCFSFLAFAPCVTKMSEHKTFFSSHPLWYADIRPHKAFC